MLWKRTRWVYFACLGIENQTDSDADMPLRLFRMMEQNIVLS